MPRHAAQLTLIVAVLGRPHARLGGAGWIPVVTLDGKATLASLAEVLSDGAGFADLSVRPHERVALIRLLTCVAHAALDGPNDYDALVIDVSVAGPLIIAGLASKEVRVLRLDYAGAVHQVASAPVEAKPVETWLSGDRLHVVSISGKEWSQCASGRRCGFGDSVEVFSFDQDAGILERLGEYSSLDGLGPFAAGLGHRFLVPGEGGVAIYRVEAAP